MFCVHISVFVCTHSPDFLVKQITGFTSSEVVGRDLVEDFIDEEYRTSVKEVLDNALQGREVSFVCACLFVLAPFFRVCFTVSFLLHTLALETDISPCRISFSLSKKAANFEFPLYTKSRQRVDVLLNATTRRDITGKVVGVLGVGQDITERKWAEEEMARVAKELQTFIDTANAPIFGIDAKGLVNEWNNKAAAITGFSRNEVMGQNLVEVYISEEFRASVQEVFDNALKGQEVCQDTTCACECIFERMHLWCLCLNLCLFSCLRQSRS